MIFETEVKDITIELILAGIISLCFFIILLHMWLCFSRKDKIHNSYHRGYNRAKDDKIEYYSTMYTLNKRFKEIMNSLESSETIMKVNILENFINFQKLLKDFQEKSN